MTLTLAGNRPSTVPWTPEENGRYWTGRVQQIESGILRTAPGHPALARMQAQLAEAKAKAGVPSDAEIAADLAEIEQERALEIAASLGWTPPAQQ